MFPTYENNHDKFLMFFNIGHHVLYPLTKFELQIQRIHGEIKRSNLSRDRLDQLKLSEE